MAQTKATGMTPERLATLLRYLLVVVIGLDLVLIVVRVLLYTPFLGQQGALIFLIEPVVLLLVYGSIVVFATTNLDPDRLIALRQGAVVGLITGTMWVVNLALETFADLSGSANLLATAPFLLGAFVLWGVAGGRVVWQSGSLGGGILAAVWAGMVCVLITITFGFLLTYTSLPRLEQMLATDPDFIRSHWADLRAFAIANSFDSAFSHLLGTLLIGTIIGVSGSLVGLFLSGLWRRQSVP